MIFWKEIFKEKFGKGVNRLGINNQTKGGKKMARKLFIVLSLVIFALSLTTFAMAQEKAKEPPKEVSKPTAEKPAASAETKAGEAKKEKAEMKKEAPAKPVVRRAGGVVKAVDKKTLILSIHQQTVKHDRVLKLKVGKKMAKELENLKAGDLVNVWLSGTTVTALNKVG